LPREVTTITLSYTFFEVGGKIPAAPAGYQNIPAIKPVALAPALPLALAKEVAL
jgi:cytochrome c oxidase assembly protein subunit 11